MGSSQVSIPKNKLLFLAVGLMLGLGGGYSGAFFIYQPKINDYKDQSDALTSEVSRLNSSVSTLEAELSQARDTISTYETQTSNLESEISSLNTRVNILYGNVTADQAKELIETIETLVILDVKTRPEVKLDKIVGSINIPLQELHERSLANWPVHNRTGQIKKSDEILVYCGSGKRSSQAMEILTENGFSAVYNMIGGTEAWKQAGYTTRENPPCPCETK